MRAERQSVELSVLLRLSLISYRVKCVCVCVLSSLLLTGRTVLYERVKYILGMAKNTNPFVRIDGKVKSDNSTKQPYKKSQTKLGITVSNGKPDYMQ